MEDIHIRQEAPEDYGAVFDLVKLAFQDLPESDQEEQFLVQRLRNSPAFIPELSLVAERHSMLLGHILLTQVQIRDGDRAHKGVLALAPVTVRPDFQRRGIGGKLILEAHHRARALGYRGIVLLGHVHYYPRFGYQKARDFGISLPFDVPEAYCMAMPLYPGGLEGVRGVVAYPPEFYG
jgi:predicted N-acetyltransferase YhbS